MVKKQGRRARLKQKKEESRQQRTQCQANHKVLAPTSCSSAATGSSSAATGSSSAVTGSSSAVTGSSSAATSSSSAATGSSSAVTGSSSAVTGSSSAATGSSSAATGSSSAVTGSSSAATGSSSAVTGSSSAETWQLSRKTFATNPTHERHSQLLALVGDDETEISDDVIDAMVELVKAHCDTKSNLCVGFYTPAQIKFLEKYPEYAFNRPIPSDKNCVLIHPLDGHWVTSFHNAKLQQVFIYDSLNNGNHLKEIKDQISIIYGNNKAAKASIQVVTQQNHLPLCGVMAVAFLVSLFLDNDPAKISYDIHRARQHLRESLASGNIESFPTINKTRVQERENCSEQKMKDLLEKYFNDQVSQSINKLKERAIDQTVNISLPFADRINDLTARKRKSRMSLNVAENERLRNRESKKRIRNNKLFTEKEKWKQKSYRQKSRQNIDIREKERQKEKQYHQKMRQNKDIREKERQKEKQYHQRTRQNKDIREKERQKEKQYHQRTRQNKDIREKERQKEKQYHQRTRQNKDIREKERQKDKQYHQRTRQNKDIREKERQKEKQYHQRMRQNKDIREKEQQKEKQYHQRMRQNKDIREKERQKEKQYHQRTRQNKDIREKERQKEKQYHQRTRQNKDIREKERQKEKQYHQRTRQNKDIREKERQKEKQYHQRTRQNKDIREKERQKEKQYHQRMRQNKDIREKERQKEKQYHQRTRQNKDIREKERQKEKQYHQRTRQNKDIREKERQKDNQYRHRIRQKENERRKTRLKQTEYRKKTNQRLIETNAVITAFRNECKQMPCCTCSVCYRFVFRKQVRTLNIVRYNEDTADFITKCVALGGLHKPLPTCLESCPDCSKWVCFTCDRNLINKKIPNQALENKLHLQPQDKCLKSLNQLEKHLVSPIIPFMKIIPLPKGQQKGVHGPVVCVPADMSTVTQVLPRQLSDRTLVKVKLKRKLQYKGHHLFQQVSMQRLKDALHHLKEINPNYTDIILDLQAINVAEEPGLIIEDKPNDQMETNHITETGPNLEETFYDLTDQMESDQHAKTVHDNGDQMIEHSAVNASNNDLSKQPRETVPDLGDYLETDHSAETLPDDGGQMETEHAVDTVPDKDLTETSTPMVSCLQQEDLQEVAAAQQHPDQHISVAPAEGQRPCSVFQEMKAFPYLFSDGKNGYSEKRSTKLGLGRYVNCRLFSRDIRFASDPQYIFFCQYITELNNIQSSTSIAMRKGVNNSIDGSKVTAQMLTDNQSREKILKSDKGYQFLKAIRGSPPYWEKCLRDLFAMVRQLGVPTWFCSFSAADRRWPEILEAICTQQNRKVPETFDWTEYCTLINSNPVTACRMFENRVLAFISTVILSPANPVGKVVDYFYRTEFQSRGWPHIHCLFWCKDAPQFKSSGSNEAFLQYVDSYISCAMPDEDEDPELFEIVSKVQLHSKNHSRSCKKGSKTCRFNFPRPISTKTFVAIPTADCETADAVKESSMKTLQAVWNIVDNLGENNTTDAKEVFASLNLPQEAYEKAFSAISSRNTVIFKRGVGDLWVNPYNTALLKAWNGNMDIQPVLDAYSCIMYIVSYISKAERELGDVLRKAQEEAKEGHMEPIQQLRKLGNVYLNAREISIMEAVYRACGMKLKQSSREVVFVPADENSAKLTKPLKVLQHAEKECEEIWMTSIIDRYLARPHTEEFEEMCLAKFASHYRVKDRSESKSNSEQEASSRIIKLLNNKGSIIKREKPAVVRYTNHNKNKNSEKYYHNIIKMYFPHREKNIKLKDDETYEQIFQQNTTTILRNMELFEKLTAELGEAWKRLQEGTPPDDVWADIASNQETTRLDDEEELEAIRREFQQDAEEIDPEDIPDHLEANREPTSRQYISLTSPKLCQNEHLQKVRSLNMHQAKFFQFVKNWAEQKESEDVEPFYLFLTGGAGTGKSHTIRCIYNEVDRTITRKSENAECPVVLLVAYTGTAAYNIGGQTIHSALKINHLRHLNEETANTLRARLQDLQLLIIDEISMVSRDLLNLIHCRLQQIKKPSRPDSIFGGISVLTVGDFYQVPPVKGMSLISINNSLTDLWSKFSIWELVQVVRQKGDTEFIEMLNRLRKRSRENDLQANDVHFLKSRIISKDSPDYPANTLHIASTHKQLNKINQEHIQRLSGKETMFNIQAADICHDKKTNTTFKKNEPIEISKPALPAYLSLCVGARVMLTQNLDVSDGLTNGGLGTVTAIIPGPMKLGLPSAVCVLFDQPNVGTTSRMKNKPPANINQQSTIIKPQTEIVRKSPEQITRHQFPFILAWAVTIHKTQGLTTDQVIVSLKGIFKAGMGYVALSRVTSASGLHLLDTDFDMSVIYADKNVQRQLQEMTAADSLPEWKNVHSFDEVTIEPQHTCIASLNCEGYNIHSQDLAKLQCLKTADIVALQETWTSEAVPIKSALSTHNIEVRHRSGSSSSARGGVAILLNQDFDYTVIDTSMLSIEALAIHIKSPKMSVVSVYRPPNIPLGNFLQQMTWLLQNLPTEVKIIAGDFNVNIRQSPNQELSQAFSCFDQVISKPTTRKRTLIDHIYVNKPALKSGVVPTYFSYHHATYVILDCENSFCTEAK